MHPNQPREIVYQELYDQTKLNVASKAFISIVRAHFGDTWCELYAPTYNGAPCFTNETLIQIHNVVWLKKIEIVTLEVPDWRSLTKGDISYET